MEDESYHKKRSFATNKHEQASEQCCITIYD